MSTQYMAIYTFLSKDIIHRIMPSPPWFDQKAHTQAYHQASLLSAPTAREQKKKKRPRLAGTHHKTDLQLSVTNRRVSCVQNLTYFTHSPRLPSTWQHWPWKQWKICYQKDFNLLWQRHYRYYRKLKKLRAQNKNWYFVRITQTLSALWGDLEICNFSVDLGIRNLIWLKWLGDS